MPSDTSDADRLRQLVVDEQMTIGQVAASLGVAPRTVHNRLAASRIPSRCRSVCVPPPGANGVGGLSANGAVTLTNSTTSGNTASAATGTGGVNANGPVTLVYATVLQNSGATSANVSALHLTSFGSVVAQPSGGGPNCLVPATTSNGFNFSDDATSASSCHFDASSDLLGAPNVPNVGALADNNGPTQTRLPLTGSPLIDAIPLASCQTDGASGITSDQRGLPRPVLGGCDIGAVEVQSPAATTTTTTTTTVATTSTATVPPTHAPAASPINIAPRFAG